MPNIQLVHARTYIVIDIIFEQSGTNKLNDVIKLPPYNIIYSNVMSITHFYVLQTCGFYVRFLHAIKYKTYKSEH